MDPNIPDHSYGDFYCRVCDSHINSEHTFDNHIVGKRHIKNIEKHCPDWNLKEKKCERNREYRREKKRADSLLAEWKYQDREFRNDQKRQRAEDSASSFVEVSDSELEAYREQLVRKLKRARRQEEEYRKDSKFYREDLERKHERERRDCEVVVYKNEFGRNNLKRDRPKHAKVRNYFKRFIQKHIEKQGDIKRRPEKKKVATEPENQGIPGRVREFHICGKHRGMISESRLFSTGGRRKHEERRHTNYERSRKKRNDERKSSRRQEILPTVHVSRNLYEKFLNLPTREFLELTLKKVDTFKKGDPGTDLLPEFFRKIEAVAEKTKERMQSILRTGAIPSSCQPGPSSMPDF